MNTTAVTTVVCFEAAGVSYCLPLQATRAVRTSADLVSLPDPAREVAGIIPGDPPLTVLSPLHADGGHIVVVEAGDERFGLLVDAVTGLQRISASEIRPAPQGQGRPLVSGTFDSDGQVVLVADPIALAARL